MRKLILLLLLTFTSFLTHAQESLVDVDDLQNAAGTIDSEPSLKILGSLVGEKFVSNPFTAAGLSEGLVGNIFFVFNSALFVIGVAFLTYTLIMQIAVSAHEGAVLGGDRGAQSLWLPIRYGLGVFGMIPAFGGFSLAQAIMFFIAILGIGLANMMTSVAIDSVDSISPIAQIVMPSSIDIDATRSNVDLSLTKTVFNMNVCKLSMQNSQKWYQQFGINPPRLVYENGLLEVKGAGKRCGSVKLEQANYRTNEGFLDRMGFRNAAINYNDIKEAGEEVYKVREVALLQLQEKVEVLATNWHNRLKLGQSPAYPLSEIEVISDDVIKMQQEGIASVISEKVGAGKGIVKDRVLKDMREGGWTSLGSWFSLYAEANSALQSAASSSSYTSTPLDETALDLGDSVEKEMFYMINSQDIQESRGTCMMGLKELNAIGECTPAQSIFSGALNMIVGGTGGNEMVNPIIATKNIGDWMLIVVGTFAGANLLAPLLEKIPVLKGASVASKVSSIVSKKGSGMGKPDGSWGAKILGMIIPLMLVLGILFAVYVPLIPFITWFTALISYFASVLEGLIAAQVWAFSHLQTQGEGMGQRAEKGYLFMLNMLLRPALMVIGFFIASGILTLLGTFFFKEFGTALANAQGNTMTGPLIMIGLLIVVGLVMITMIQTVFNLIYEIPDRVIAWFGSGMEARMAKEMDQSIEGKTREAARWTGGTAIAGLK